MIHSSADSHSLPVSQSTTCISPVHVLSLSCVEHIVEPSNFSTLNVCLYVLWIHLCHFYVLSCDTWLNYCNCVARDTFHCKQLLSVRLVWRNSQFHSGQQESPNSCPRPHRETSWLSVTRTSHSDLTAATVPGDCKWSIDRVHWLCFTLRFLFLTQRHNSRGSAIAACHVSCSIVAAIVIIIIIIITITIGGHDLPLAHNTFASVRWLN